MDKLVIHPATRVLLDAYLRSPAQGILICGPVGIGSRTIAQNLSHELGARTSDVHIIAPDEKGTVPIEKIRALNTITRAVYDSPRVIIIDDADAMSHPAQNALLKLLEEPPKQTYFLLTSHQPQLLLQTIRSRVQLIDCRPVNEEASRLLIEKLSKTTDSHAQLLFIAQGLPAELTRLVSDSAYFDSQVALVTEARSLLQADTYQRLVLVKNYSERGRALALVTMLGRLLHFSLIRQSWADLAHSLEMIETIYGSLQANGNVRIQMTYLATHLP